MVASAVRPGRVRIALALGAVWVIWGATYIGIRVAVETIPPFLATGARFALASLVLALIVVVRRGVRALAISRRQVRDCALAATLLLGSVVAMTVAERDVASNLAAMIGSGTACWVVLARLALRERVPRGTLVGVPVGLLGLGVLLVVGADEAVAATTAGILAALVSSWLWTAGSVVSPRLDLPSDMLVTATWETLCGALLMLPIGVALGELDGFALADVSGRSFAGWLFLALAGSVVAFTAYAWLLQNVALSTAVTNQYVNPIVALSLGWLLLGEHLGPSLLLGGGLVIGAVVLIVRAEARARSAG